MLTKEYFKMSNHIYSYGLRPVQIAVYSYLCCRAGQRDYCWPSMKTIARSVGCSVNTARAAVDELCRRELIRKTPTYQDVGGNRSRQANNTYYLFDLPPLPEKDAVTEL